MKPVPIILVILSIFCFGVLGSYLFTGEALWSSDPAHGLNPLRLFCVIGFLLAYPLIGRGQHSYFKVFREEYTFKKWLLYGALLSAIVFIPPLLIAMRRGGN